MNKKDFNKLNPSDWIILYSIEEYQEKCKKEIEMDISGEIDYEPPYNTVIRKHSKEPAQILTISKADPETQSHDEIGIFGSWRIYRKGIKNIVTPESHPEFYL